MHESSPLMYSPEKKLHESEFCSSWGRPRSSRLAARETQETPRSQFDLTGDFMEESGVSGAAIVKPCNSRSALTAFLPEGEASSSTESPSTTFSTLPVDERMAVEALLKLQDTEKNPEKTHNLFRLSSEGLSRGGFTPLRVSSTYRDAAASGRRKKKSIKVVIKSCKQSRQSPRNSSIHSSSNWSDLDDGLESRKRASEVKNPISRNRKFRRSTKIEKWTFLVRRRPIKKVRSLNKIVSSMLAKTTKSASSSFL